MKKPVNKFAVALWVIAVLVLIGEMASSLQVYDTMKNFRTAEGGGTTYIVFTSLARVVQGALTSSVIIAAFGYMIELLDRIHWTLQHRSKETA